MWYIISIAEKKLWRTIQSRFIDFMGSKRRFVGALWWFNDIFVLMAIRSTVSYSLLSFVWLFVRTWFFIAKYQQIKLTLEAGIRAIGHQRRNDTDTKRCVRAGGEMERERINLWCSQISPPFFSHYLRKDQCTAHVFPHMRIISPLCPGEATNELLENKCWHYYQN